MSVPARRSNVDMPSVLVDWVEKGEAPNHLEVHDLSGLVFMVSPRWFECRMFDQPNVNAKASTPGLRNSISNWRSMTGCDWRTS